MIVHILGVPMDLGSGRRGVDMGPSAIRIAGVADRLRELGHKVVDGGDLVIKNMEELKVGNVRARYLGEIARVSALLARKVENIMERAQFPLVLGGDHSIAVGTVSGIAAVCQGRGKKLGLLWIDAHGDINTPATTPSRRVHGMPVAIALGYGPRVMVAVGHQFDMQLDDLVYIGVRNLDSGERALLRQSPAQVFTMAHVNRLGVADVAAEAVGRLQQRGVDAVHVSFDLDVLDPHAIHGIGSPEPGGLTYREADQLLMLLRDSDLPIVSADFGELDPTLDPSGASARLAAGLAARLLGEEIL
jgi:arginase